MRTRLHKCLIRFIRMILESDLFNSIEKTYIDVKTKKVLKRLKYCGKNVRLQWPVIITNPEQVSLGDDVSVAGFVHFWSAGGVTVGDRVMIGTHTSITSQTHDSSQAIMFDTNVHGPVTIEEDVWIGSNCVILPGIKIGKGAVVGAGSVVTKDVKPYTIVAGVPARILRDRVLENTTPRIIL